jgi:hypothetical protein
MKPDTLNGSTLMQRYVGGSLVREVVYEELVILQSQVSCISLCAVVRAFVMLSGVRGLRRIEAYGQNDIFTSNLMKKLNEKVPCVQEFMC